MSSVRVVRGAPTEEELAALLALVASAGGDAAPPAAAPLEGRWNDPRRRLRRPPRPGPGSWRSSLR